MHSGNVTNLDFVEYLLKKVPIQMPRTWATPLMYTILLPVRPNLLNWPTTDANIPLDLESFLAIVGITFFRRSCTCDNPTRSKSTVLQQWRETKRCWWKGAADTGISAD
jgi:hypothetical protein